jgi:hypothetical protein
MPMADESDIAEQVKRQIARDSLMTAPGVKQLLDGSPVTNADDRKRLAGLLFYLYGRLSACPPPPPRKPSWHDG